MIDRKMLYFKMDPGKIVMSMNFYVTLYNWIIACIYLHSNLIAQSSYLPFPLDGSFESLC